MHTFYDPHIAEVARVADRNAAEMSMLSAAWNRNKGAIASLTGKVLSGNLVGAASELAGDARAEAGRVIARTGAPATTQAALQVQADNAINVVAAGAGVNQPSFLNPLGTTGSQRVALGGASASVNQIAIVIGGLLLIIVVVMMARKR